jgi:hypothetical protein
MASGPWDDYKEDGPWSDYEPEKKTLLDAIKRQAGLGVRNAVQGVAGLPGMFLDPFQRLAGMQTIGGATDKLLTAAGLPQEVTPQEQLAGAGTRAIAGGAGFAKAAQMIPAALKMAPEVVNNIMAQKPLAQMFQAGVGGLAGEGTRQMGGNEWLQLLASATAPMAASGVVGAARVAGRGANALREPWTQKGAEQVAADTLGKVAVDKVRAASDLDYALAAQRSGDTVGTAITPPGFKPTAAAGTKDFGIIGAEQMLAKQAERAPYFAERHVQNNAALTEDLLRLRANSAKLDQWKALREKTTGPMRESAFDNAKGPVDYGPVADKIVRIAGTAEGGAVESQKALQWLTDRLKWYADEGRFDPRNAYELEKDIAKLVAGKIDNPSGNGRLKLAGGTAEIIRKELIDQIDNAAPGFKKYMRTYSDMSKSIDRLETVKKSLGKGREPLLNVTTAEDMVSQAKLRNVVPGIEETLAKKKQLPLNDFQRQIFGRVDSALENQTRASRGGKSPGSDTFQNLSTDNFFHSILGDQLVKAGLPNYVTKPVEWLYGRKVEPRIQDKITRAFLDQQLMADLLRKARTARRNPTWKDLATSAEQNIYGGLLGNALR